MKHTCETGERARCEPCMLLEVDLWDAINRYAISVGGDPSKHVYGNVSRMQAVADVGATVRRAATGDPEIQQLRLDHAHLTRLYAESRDYVATLTRERDDLVASVNRDVAERDQLDAVCEVARDLLRVWKFEQRAPNELLDRLEELLRLEVSP